MVTIQDIEIYHSENLVDNTKYLVGKDEKQRHFLEDILGRKYRYEINDGTTILQMLERVSRKIMMKNNLTGNDIDMIVVTCLVPEFFSPPTAVALHYLLGIKRDCIAFDMNACCLNMSLAMQQVEATMKLNPKIRRTLIVCFDKGRIAPEDNILYGAFGDLSCAMLLEQDNRQGNLIEDSRNLCYSEEWEQIVYPLQGMTSVIESNNQNKFGVRFEAKANIHLNEAASEIASLMVSNHLTVDNIALFCASQYVWRNQLEIMKKLHIPESKSPYVGDKYGYTEGTSPFVVMYEAIKQNKLQRGDKILLWTIGAGFQHIILLINY